MKIIAMTSQKGGSGKSTLAVSLAAAAARDGETVLAIDLDPQGTLSIWGSRRKEAAGVETVKIGTADLAELLGQVRASGQCNLVLIDTPGFHDADLGLALQEVDLCLVPVRPTAADLDAVVRTTTSLRLMGKRWAFVVNMAKTQSTGRTLDVAKHLIGLGGSLVPGYVSDRTDFMDTMITGQGVTEYNAAGKGAKELEVVWAWVKSNLRGDQNDQAKAA